MVTATAKTSLALAKCYHAMAFLLRLVSASGSPGPCRPFNMLIASLVWRPAGAGTWLALTLRGGPKTLITVGYGDRAPKKAGFIKERTFGPSSGRTLMGKASKSIFRPAGGRC
jgi:hypothetical protein